MLDLNDYIQIIYKGVKNKRYRIICDICGDKTTYQAKSKRKKLHYCKKCQYKKLSKQFSQPKIVKKCDYCGKEIQLRNKSQYKRAKHHFCNNKCLGLFKRKKITEVVRSQLKKKMLQLQNNAQCALCKHDHVWNLEVHHIIPVSLGGQNDLDNLMFLCRNCHNDQHSGIQRKNICQN